MRLKRVHSGDHELYWRIHHIIEKHLRGTIALRIRDGWISANPSVFCNSFARLSIFDINILGVVIKRR